MPDRLNFYPLAANKVALDMLSLGMDIDDLGLVLCKWRHPRTGEVVGPPESQPVVSVGLLELDGVLAWSAQQAALEKLGPAIKYMTYAANSLNTDQLAAAETHLHRGKQTLEGYRAAQVDPVVKAVTEKIENSIAELESGIIKASEELAEKSQARLLALAFLVNLHARRGETAILELVSEEQWTAWRATIVEVMGKVGQPSFQVQELPRLLEEPLLSWAEKVQVSQRPVNKLPRQLLLEALAASETTEQGLDRAWKSWSSLLAAKTGQEAFEFVQTNLEESRKVVMIRYWLARTREDSLYSPVRKLWADLLVGLNRDSLICLNWSMGVFAAAQLGRSVEQLLLEGDLAFLEDDDPEEVLSLATQLLDRQAANFDKVEDLLEAARDALAPR